MSIRSIAVKLALFSFALAFPFQHANAATVFNFATLAQNPAAGVGEGFWSDKFGVGGYAVGGITVFATASGDPLSKAYLDGPSGGLGGLGVCSTMGGCAGSSDDNVGRARDNSGNALEKLTLTFSTQVLLSDLIFNNRDHGLFNGILGINGTNYTVSGGHLVVALLGTIFNFDALACGSGCDSRLARDFYVGQATVSAVPLPPAVLLFASGLGLMGLLARRRKQKGAAFAV